MENYNQSVKQNFTIANQSNEGKFRKRLTGFISHYILTSNLNSIFSADDASKTNVLIKCQSVIFVSMECCYKLGFCRHLLRHFATIT